MKVSDLKSKQLMCPYCNLATFEAHPNYSCPRIAEIELDPDGNLIGVSFHEPPMWEGVKAMMAADDDNDG